MKKSFYLIVLLIICIYWGGMGFYIGVKYEESNQYTEKHYIYKNKCLAIYKGAWLTYDCMDSTLESK